MCADEGGNFGNTDLGLSKAGLRNNKRGVCVMRLRKYNNVFPENENNLWLRSQQTSLKSFCVVRIEFAPVGKINALIS